MLERITALLKQQPCLSNQQLARALAMDMSALEPILALGLRKGYFCELGEGRACSTACAACPSVRVRYFELTPKHL